MDDSTLTTLEFPERAFDLGEMMGSRRAFSVIAGRCSAADAACLRRVRDEKLYKHKAESWDEFCPKYLGMSKASANRVIRLLEEFGADYFEMAQLFRVTPEQFRAISPAVKDKAIYWNGDAIALLPENAEKVAAAVEELRKAAEPAPKPALSRAQRIAAIQRAGEQLVAEFTETSRSCTSKQEKASLGAVRVDILNRLAHVDIVTGPRVDQNG